MRIKEDRGRLRPLIATVTAVAAAVAFVPATAGAAGDPQKIKVETRNLYLGADLTPAIAAPNPPAAFAAAGDIYRSVLDTNFVARSKRIVDELELRKPHLVGLQEVALWRRGQRGAPDGNNTPATEEVVDFLDVLMHEIDKAGLNYEVAVVQQEADIELPVDIDQPSDGTPDFDGRLTMHDAILVRGSVRKVKNPFGTNFSTNLTVPTTLGNIPVLRGYTSVDVKLKRRSQLFRFINTHLEAFNAFIRNGQATELIGNGGITTVNRPVVIVGDLNSDPDDPSVDPQGVPTANAAAYNTVTGAGFIDYGILQDTCCHGADLLDTPPASFSSRIDHVVAKGEVSPLKSWLLGDDADNRTPTGLWPSDHGGVVAKLKVG